MTDVKPALGMHAFPLDGCALLLSEPRQELHVLNEAGAHLWHLLEEGRSRVAIRHALGRTLGLTDRAAGVLLRETLGAWTAQGLVAPESSLGRRAEASPPPVDAAVVPAAAPRLRTETAKIAVTHCYRLLDTRFRINFATRDLAEAVHPALAHLALQAGETAEGTEVIRLDIVPQEGCILLRSGDETWNTCSGIESLAPLVKGEVWAKAVNRQGGALLGLHAGVVTTPDGAVLLPGASGSGKSTLTAQLVQAGFTYYSDELALLRNDDLQVLPVPLAFCVKQSGVAALAPHYPELAEQPRFHLRADGKRVTYVAPPPARLPQPGEASPVRVVIFPQHAAQAEEARLERLTPLTALQRLLSECLVVGMRLDAARVGALVRWINAVPCFALRYAASAQALDGVRQVLAQVPPAEHGPEARR